ncbi:hypothetical protein HII13_003663 [Brettanomyces bruxellensis]|uniref:DEBR0S3_14158g1_1 n=1 Tax=Dekkera bruxellensis TaxID=5007 RepID=A0A3F2Y277_DEKBR|nr:uncharacterized protein BRETT_003843 [Brettanomyces bruxellensis]KAF6009024.1 hypothetical protein HII13_003663 [Brettanomyces bruxellensis]KAF6015675.1 hypothetical protein HII12_000837 [Brettanomyces bruxellensis]QOU19692.1 hypothetical protein BRETT_003843 [Brettanomyces bruxellensis]VUG18543.1 CCC1 [Brettanomyces bruxellensis]
MSLVATKKAITGLITTFADKVKSSGNASNASDHEHDPLIVSPNTSASNINTREDGSHSGHTSTVNVVDTLYVSSTPSVSSTNANASSKFGDKCDESSSSLGIFGKVDPRVMSDLIIGLSDGLTVPFALTAGLSSLGNSKLVITGGMAELVSGAISMGLGGYLAAKSESQYYDAQVGRERQLYFDDPEIMAGELQEIIINMGGSIDTADMLINDLSSNPKLMIDFIIRYGRGLEEPAENRQLTSALTIGSGYFFGGFIPLVPYFFSNTVGTGLTISVVVMLITLFWFGFFKARISMGSEVGFATCLSEGLQMILVGSLAAGSAWLLVDWIDS